MQKISKQMLAIMSLSILLAVALALTFTFAALSQSTRNATGTITFDGNYYVAWSAEVSGIVTDCKNGEVKFTLGEEFFDVNPDATSITASLKNVDVLSGIKVTFANTTKNATNYQVVGSGDDLACTYQAGFNAKQEISANTTLTFTLDKILADIDVTDATKNTYTLVLAATVGIA